MHEKVLDIETADGHMETFLCWPERNETSSCYTDADGCARHTE